MDTKEFENYLIERSKNKEESNLTVSDKSILEKLEKSDIEKRLNLLCVFLDVDTNEIMDTEFFTYIGEKFKRELTALLIATNTILEKKLKTEETIEIALKAY